MDLRRLRILRELADRGSVGATAEAMNITPSAVSQQLKVLQDEVSVVLVRREGRGVKLTEAGLAMAAAGAEVSTAMERAQATVDFYRKGWQTQIRAAFFPSSAEMFLPGLLHRIKEIPGLQFDAFHEDPMVSGFVPLTADYDFVVAHGSPGADVFSQPGVVVVPLLKEPLDVAMPTTHPLAGKAGLTPEDVVDYTWIGVPEGFPFDSILAQVEARTGRRVTRSQRYPDLRVMEALVSAGHGLAFLPRYTALGSGGRGYVLRPLEGVSASRSIVALARPDIAERTTIQQVLGLLKRVAQNVADDVEMVES
ncbi:LysR family transcriptional regulator [Arthrobacter castelli]|uniref:LysR family transcriptional regulator n=1 Tax=Arthrobacter castelli TaxID=271431 RepID=UPI00047C5C46|nr:LysR family transcriptional regulator [Arthrobacter castelli]